MTEQLRRFEGLGKPGESTVHLHVYDGKECLGYLTLFKDGSATVINDYAGVQQWFDSKQTGHSDALRYVFSRMTIDPRFVKAA